MQIAWANSSLPHHHLEAANAWKQPVICNNLGIFQYFICWATRTKLISYFQIHHLYMHTYISKIFPCFWYILYYTYILSPVSWIKCILSWKNSPPNDIICRPNFLQRKSNQNWGFLSPRFISPLSNWSVWRCSTQEWSFRKHLVRTVAGLDNAFLTPLFQVGRLFYQFLLKFILFPPLRWQGGA